MLEAANARPSVVLAAYAEPLLDGRRVIVFGDSSSGLAQELIERGARLVHVYDPDPARVAESAARNTSRDVSIGPLGESGLAVRDGAFDLGLVEDLIQAGPAHSVLKRLRRALSPRGVALVAAPNPEVFTRLVPAGPIIDSELDYYQLYDAVAAEFAQVRMLGQTPFVGYAVVDFAAGNAPEPSLDTAFVPGGAEEPEWFVALASAMPIRLDEYSVVQLPMRAVRFAVRGDETSAELERAEAAERRGRERVAELENRVNELTAALRAAERRDPSAEAVRRLEAELAKRDKWIAELEARAAVADARADEVQTELDEERERNAGQNRSAELEAQIQALHSEADSLRARVQEQAERIAKLMAPDLEADDVPRLEAQLVERGRELRRVERQLQESERVGRELLSELERVAEVNAEREADLEAARWTVEQLESGTQAGQILNELDRVRAALQEKSVLLHQARGHWST